MDNKEMNRIAGDRINEIKKSITPKLKKSGDPKVYCYFREENGIDLHDIIAETIASSVINDGIATDEPNIQTSTAIELEKLVSDRLEADEISDRRLFASAASKLLNALGEINVHNDPTKVTYAGKFRAAFTNDLNFAMNRHEEGWVVTDLN